MNAATFTPSGPGVWPLSERLAEFAARADHRFPALARARAADAMTDCVGCLLAGSQEPVASIVRKVITRSNRGALLLGDANRAAPADAALFHGTLAHAVDYDDTNHPAYAHPSAVLVPAMFAVAEQGGATGEDLITAYIVGFQIFGKLGRALNFAHYQRGWHPTCTFGTLAAAAAAARLLGLTIKQTSMALGIAASAASGLRANFGSMVKPLHAGYAARNGVLAALLAEQGMVASELALDHEYGFCQVFNEGLPCDPVPLAQWDEPLEILTRHGLALKSFPACGAAHTAIEAAIALRAAIGGKTIRAVTAHVAQRAFAPLIHASPRTPLEGKFSLQFCVAAALVDGTVNLATFTPEKLHDPAISGLIGKIAMIADPSFPEPEEFPVRLEVRTEDGTLYERTVPLAMGKAGRWPTIEQQRAKFLDCARGSLAPDAAGAAFETLRAIDSRVPAVALLRALANANNIRSEAVQ
jgi:2-methylcitrate dehydratase PrpD